MKIAFDIIRFGDHGENFLLCHDSKFCLKSPRISDIYL